MVAPASAELQPRTPKRASRARTLALAVAFALAAALWYAWSLSQPRYRWFVSQPLDAKGRRVRVLVPKGWELNRPGYQATIMTGSRSGPMNAQFIYHPSAMNRWLASHLHIGDGADGQVLVRAAWSNRNLMLSETAAAEGDEAPGMLSTFGTYGARRFVKVSDPAIIAVVGVATNRRSTLAAVCPTVLNSLRVD